MALTAERLHEVVTELVTRPGHEKVRTLMYVLLVEGLGVWSSEILMSGHCRRYTEGRMHSWD